MSDLTGRVAIVTGAAGGLGRAFSSGLLSAGARVALFDLAAASPSAAAGELGGGALPVEVDVTDPVSVRNGVEQVRRELGAPDLLVNNAGVRFVAPFESHPMDAWQTTLDVNLTGPFLCTQAVLPSMLEKGRGRIVNVASTAAELALTQRAAYNVSKAGIVMLTKSVACELGARGIRCNAIAPGVIETDLNRSYFEDERLRERILEGTPVGRWGHPADLVGALLFLAGDASDFVNGATLFVDGGWMSCKGY